MSETRHNLSHFFRQFFHRKAQKGNLSKHRVTTKKDKTTKLANPNRAKKNANMFGQEKPQSGPKQMTFHFKNTQPKMDVNQPPYYNNVKEWFRDNFDINGDDYIYKGPDLSEFGFKGVYGYRPIAPGTVIEYPLRFLEDIKKYMEVWNQSMFNKVKYEWEERQKKAKEMHLRSKLISRDDLQEIVSELVSEELSEINYTHDDSGKNIIAIGAPNSVARFASEHPNLMKVIQGWVKQNHKGDLDVPENHDNTSPSELLKLVQGGFPGGLKAFIANAKSKAQVPSGIASEGFGAGNPKDDPKHIKGERWRIKFQSDSDLKKHGDTEMSSVNEGNISKKELHSILKELISEMWVNEAYDDIEVKIKPNNSNEIAQLIFNLKEGTGIWFSYDKEGRSGHYDWVEKVSNGLEYEYYAGVEEKYKEALEDDEMIEARAKEIADDPKLHYYAIVPIQNYVSPRSRHSQEDDQQPGHYELYGADRPEPQY